MLNRRQFLLGAATVLLSASGCARPRSGPIPLEPPRAEEEGPRPFRVAILSDPHTVPADSNLAEAINGKLRDAVADYRPLRPDLWVVNGDIADQGKTEGLAAFKQIMAAVAKTEHLLVNTGNHDFYGKDATDEEELRRFREAFGLERPYTSRVVGGLHLVMLADEQYKTAPGPREWAWLTAEQLRWFERVLNEHRDKQTLVFLHQPLQDTVVWSHGGNSFAGCGKVKELQGIMQTSPQIKLWFSGHCHMGAEVEGNVVSRGGVTYVGLGSTFYQLVKSTAAEDQGGWPSDGGFRKDLSANQSRLLEVWSDRLVIRARDHLRQAWMDEHELVLKRT